MSPALLTITCTAGERSGCLPAATWSGLEQGFDEDELVALELGAESMEALTAAQRAYAPSIKKKLLQVRTRSGRAWWSRGGPRGSRPARMVAKGA